MSKVYGVTFKEGGKAYHFVSHQKEIPLNVTVIVDTEKGLQFGKVVSEITNITDMESLKPIVRVSTKSDYNQYLDNLRDAKEALDYARDLADKLSLEMRFIDSSFTFDRNQLLLNFLADERVDFRELAKKIASKYRTRIELRQVGARDKAREVSGLGVCGRPLCCSTFLTHIDSVSLNLAKNQNLSLNPSKINGSCGRLLCCLTYEDDVYTECRKGLPSIGQTVSTPSGKGKVISLDILNRTYRVMVNNEIIEMTAMDRENRKK